MRPWHHVFESVGEEYGWGPPLQDLPPLRDLPTVYIKETLPTLQHILLRTQGDGEGAEFMASFDTTTEQGCHGKERMLSTTNGAALTWAMAVPGASTARCSNNLQSGCQLSRRCFRSTVHARDRWSCQAHHCIATMDWYQDPSSRT